MYGLTWDEVFKEIGKINISLLKKLKSEEAYKDEAELSAMGVAEAAHDAD